MQKKHLLLFLLFVCLKINAQNNFVSKELFGSEAEKVFDGATHVWLKQENIVPTYMEFRTEKAMTELDFLLQLKKKFGLSDRYSFHKIGEERDQIGYVHKRYQLEVDHIPVVDAIFILHLQGEKVIKYNGYLFHKVNTNSTPTLSEDKALRVALSEINARQYKWESSSEESFIKREQKNPEATFYPKGVLMITQSDGNIASNNFVLCWKFDVYAQEPMGRYNIYINASTGAMIKKENRICTSDVAGTAHTVYRGVRAFTTDSLSPSNYRLKESARGLGIHTYDMRRGTNYGSAAEFTDSNNVWNNINANLDQYAADAHWGAEMTYDFYASKGRSSIDGAGFPLNLYVHYGVSYFNAFWDGSRMTFGDGSSPYTPLVSLDITAHEISHGLDQLTAGLTYSYESGALNESFSDIFGAAVEYFADSTTANWLLGEDIGLSFRSFSNPNTYGDPDTYLGTNWYAGSGDAGGVHTNSGVQNYWYYLLSMGGTGVNDIGNSFSVTGLGRDKATDIAWRNMVYYLTPSSQYADARFYAIQSAVDLYGACTPEVQATTNAWYAVGVGAVYTATVDAAFTNSMSVACAAPFSINFNNRSFNADVYNWNFGDGSFSSAVSPTHTYTLPGSYTVKLVASGGACGVDSIVYAGLVNISDTIPCVAIMPTSGSGSVQSGCTGTMYDDGGRLGLYSDNVDANITISPIGASSVTLNFSSFRMEYAYDTLFVYDGPSTSSPLIQSTTGYSLPASITSSGPSITVRQFTDGGVVDTGFALTWSCNILRPIAYFRGVDSVSCSGIINFTDLSLRSPTNWLWTFGDGDSSHLQNPTHRYVSNGTYTVRLIASNSAGADTIIKTSYIVVNKPAGPIAINGSRCGTGVVLLGVSPALGTFKWYDSNISDSILGVGLSFVTPSLILTSTYYVESVVGSCVSLRTPVTARIRSTSTGSLAIGICPGSSYFFNGVPLIASGTYLDTLSNVEGCDSILTLNLTVNLSNTASISVSICSGTSYFFNGASLISPGIYKDTLVNISGCDSILTLNLSLLPSSSATIAVDICAGGSYLFNGVNRTLSGIYLDTLNNSIGCDSFLTLNLRVATLGASSALPISICQGSSYFFNGVNRNVAGFYSDTLVSSGGCDSIVVLNLGIIRKDTVTATIGICSGSSYLFNGMFRSTAGVYLDTLLNVYGCDSFVTLNLSILSPSSGSFSVNICNGTSYFFNGINRIAAGTFQDTLINIVGCDSFLTLRLSVLSTSTNTIIASICNGNSYLFNGINRMTAGTYFDTLPNYLGCDSFLTLNLSVRSSSTGTFAVSICSGSAYFFNGLLRTIAGVYLDTISNHVGCDSFLTLNLSVRSASSYAFDETICGGSTYPFNGRNLSSTGSYMDTLINYLGCDSLLTLHLLVNPSSSTINDVSICNGDFYFFNGLNLNTAGTYLDTFTNLLGCDSIITLHLIIDPSSNGTISESIGTGDSFLFNGIQRTLSGVYHDTLVNYLGCDSFLTLNLSVQPNSIQDIEHTILNLSVMPNPAKSKAVLSYQLAVSTSKMTITLLNVEGKTLMKDIISSPALVGNYFLNLGLYADGLYFIHVETDHGIVTRKMIIEKD